ncbi:MAG TPA: hypothetical protein DDY70_06090 [Clostridiales bacterium]|mgnify:CR=1 FL=1|nr:hypothetical protein [Clostridiales bacterium]
MKFKEKIVKLRKLKGLTQDEFASAVGVSRQAVYKWECGQSYPEVAKLLEIKMLFGISIDDLLDESYEVIVPEKKKRKRRPKTEEELAAAAAAKAAKAEANKEKSEYESYFSEPTMDDAAIRKEILSMNEEKKEEAPKAEEPKVEVKAEVKVEAKPEPKPAPAPKAEAPKVEKKPEAPKAAPKAEEKPVEKESKGGLFSRLFGGKK